LKLQRVGYTLGRNNQFFSRGRAARRQEVLASIGRELRNHYDSPQPLSDRLAELVRKIERSASKVQDACGDGLGPKISARSLAGELVHVTVEQILAPPQGEGTFVASLKEVVAEGGSL
jgi:hypothetical protein